MKKVLVPLAQGCEELEAVTIIDLLRRANIEVITASLDEQPVKASRGVVLIADTTIDAVDGDTFDMIVLPGGLPGSDHLDQDSRIGKILSAAQQQGGYIAAICAAPKVLANAGMLDGKSATSYPGVLKSMALKSVNVVDQAVIQDGQIITSRGPGTAMEFALTLIEILTDLKIRNQVEAGLAR